MTVANNTINVARTPAPVVPVFAFVSAYVLNQAERVRSSLLENKLFSSGVTGLPYSATGNAASQ
jgi:hypothetical protein